MIELKELHKRYGENEVLRDISLKIENGEIFTIIGSTGAGKTTLLRLIDLLEMPTSGEIYFDGVDANASKRKRLEMRRRMSMLFQKPVVFNTSVYDNITYGLKFRGEGKRSIDEKVYRALAMVELSEYAKRDALTLSGGETQRVALARAIVTEPEVLLLDEPTANLDPISTEKIEELILRINHEYETAIIMATHNMLQGQRLADRIGVIMNGEVSQTGTPMQVFNAPVSEKIARFVGVENIISGVVESNENGLTVVSAFGEKITGISNFKGGDKVLVCMRPEDIILSKETIKSSTRNEMRVKISKMSSIGPLVRVKMENSLVALITKQSAEDLGLRESDEVYAAFKSTSVHLLRESKNL